MSEVTRVLNAITQGDDQAASQLLPLVYEELRKLAAHRLAHQAPGQTLQPTALVHEAYLRLVGAPGEGKGVRLGFSVRLPLARWPAQRRFQAQSQYQATWARSRKNLT
jgi:hypothetical protein